MTLGTYDPRTGASATIDISGNSDLVTIDPYAVFIQTALCYLVQLRTGDPIVLLGQPYGSGTSRRDTAIAKVLRMRRFTCATLLCQSPRHFIETRFNGGTYSAYHAREALRDRQTWVAEVMNNGTGAGKPLLLSFNEMTAWQRDVEGSDLVNAWLDSIFPV